MFSGLIVRHKLRWDKGEKKNKGETRKEKKRRTAKVLYSRGKWGWAEKTSKHPPLLPSFSPALGTGWGLGEEHQRRNWPSSTQPNSIQFILNLFIWFHSTLLKTKRPSPLILTPSILISLLHNLVLLLHRDFNSSSAYAKTHEKSAIDLTAQALIALWSAEFKHEKKSELSEQVPA